MGLADEIEAVRSEIYGRRGGTCSMRTLLDILAPEDRAALEELLRDIRVHGTTIAQVLNSWGPKLGAEALKIKAPEGKKEMVYLADLCENMSGGTIQRHRRGLCHCPKGT